jgi:hypothetical protein
VQSIWPLADNRRKQRTWPRAVSTLPSVLNVSSLALEHVSALVHARSHVPESSQQTAVPRCAVLKAYQRAKPRSTDAESEELFSDTWAWEHTRIGNLLRPTTAQMALLIATLAAGVLLAVAAVIEAACRVSAGSKTRWPRASTCVRPALRLAGARETLLWILKVGLCLGLAACMNCLPPARPPTHSPHLFCAFLVLLAAISLMWQRPVDKPSTLSREITDEWRGWMQATFLLYHAFAMDELFAPIRVLVSTHVWLTGFGHGVYCLRGGVLSFQRLGEVTLRLNGLALLLSLATATPFDAYYVCILHSVHVLQLFLAFSLSRIVERMRISSSAYGDDALRSLGMLVATAAVSILLWDSPLHKLLSQFFSTERATETFFRLWLDRFSSIGGVVTSVVVVVGGPRARLATPIAQFVWLLVLSLLSLGGAVCWVSAWWQVYISSVERGDEERHVEYSQLHPYVGTLVAPLYALVRSSSRFERSVSVPLQFIGARSLELYLLQFHLFLTRSAAQVPTLVPDATLNTVLLLPTYGMVAHCIHWCLGTKQLSLLASRLPCMLVGLAGAVLGGLHATGELSRRTMWTAGATAGGILLGADSLRLLGRRSRQSQRGGAARSSSGAAGEQPRGIMGPVFIIDALLLLVFLLGLGQLVRAAIPWPAELLAARSRAEARGGACYASAIAAGSELCLPGGTHLVMLGDSTMDYQYLNLVSGESGRL